jgi:hypothetical protein
MRAFFTGFNRLTIVAVDAESAGFPNDVEFRNICQQGGFELLILGDLSPYIRPTVYMHSCHFEEQMPFFTGRGLAEPFLGLSRIDSASSGWKTANANTGYPEETNQQ